MWPRCELDSTCRPTSRVESFARGTDEENDQEPYIMHSYDLFVFCFDSPDLNYDDYFSMAIPHPWRVQFWGRGGLHDHPVISGYILEDHTQPSRTEAPVLSE
eukprot:s10816_g1.t1